MFYQSMYDKILMIIIKRKKEIEKLCVFILRSIVFKGMCVVKG